MSLIYVLSVFLFNLLASNQQDELGFDLSETTNIADTTSVRYLMGKFDASKHVDFERISLKYCNREDLFLRKEALHAYFEMEKTARKAGVKLVIISATRNFQQQKRIWEKKWSKLLSDEQSGKVGKRIAEEKAKEILKFSSMPGSSRHHWGTDIDLNSLTDDYFRKGEGEKVYRWLILNAARFGFCQPYTSKKNGRTGYEEEKWHWTYVPLSKEFTLAARNKLKDNMFDGFLGSEVAPNLRIVNHYMLGVSEACSK
ncbi:MAG: M15 family metallopeptidase [Saprospiraceae bacterium]